MKMKKKKKKSRISNQIIFILKEAKLHKTMYHKHLKDGNMLWQLNRCVKREKEEDRERRLKTVFHLSWHERVSAQTLIHAVGHHKMWRDITTHTNWQDSDGDNDDDDVDSDDDDDCIDFRNGDGFKVTKTNNDISSMKWQSQRHFLLKPFREIEARLNLVCLLSRSPC